MDAQKLSDAFALIRDAALRRFWLDDLFMGVYRGVILGFSRIVGWIDRYLVDGIVNVLSAWTLRSAIALRGIQSGLAQDYVYAVAIGVLLCRLEPVARYGIASPPRATRRPISRGGVAE